MLFFQKTSGCISNLVLLVIFLLFTTSCSENGDIEVGQFTSGAQLILQENPDKKWGIAVASDNLTSFNQTAPVRIEYYLDSAHIMYRSSGYDSIHSSENGFTGVAQVQINDILFKVTDHWLISGDKLTLSRKLVVHGSGPGGFLSDFCFNHDATAKKIKFFAPGMIFGDAGHLTRVAIGGSEGGTATWIREDRLPAPLFGLYAEDGTSVTMLDPAPDGSTTREDSRDRQITTLIDKRFKFGALGAEENKNEITFGFKWPGTEGETTYRGYHFPGGQVKQWRRRYHPVEDSLRQDYTIIFRLGQDQTYRQYYTTAWRWAWEILKPKVNRKDIFSARKSLIDMLASRVETANGITGIANITSFANARSDRRPEKRKSIMGFAGRTLESANFLLEDANLDARPEASDHRKKGLAIINSYIKLKLDPPEGIGYWLNDGAPAAGVRNLIFLRYLGDGLKALLKAAKRERQQQREHPEWISWAQSFADWLLPQQSKAGGFPRAWEPVTGRMIDSSQQSTYTVIPYLLLLTELTGDDRYREAAIKAGEFCWKNGQSKGIFVGGTVDNPDVVDKEAGTLSLEAYLALYEATGEDKWLERAKAAANFAETWMYIWHVPMPVDEHNEDLHWKKGISTVGLQLISTGHSLVDAYMSYDVDEYAKLALLTGDDHYLKVAAILLHNTKGMLAIPGRTYDLPGPGWQQEHWSLAPERGLGRKRAWLPWVTTSHLNGIIGLEKLDKELFRRMSAQGHVVGNLRK